MSAPNPVPIRWGILGTGTIATALAEALAAVPDAALVAVGSRSQASADRFAERHAIERRHPSYQALAADPDVDVVYVATPHALHHANTLMALRAGKHVLCEKPFALNARQAREMVAAARQSGRFLMEAMWTRLLPLMVHLHELIAAGALGETRVLSADFGFRADDEPGSILFDPALGGGALLDVGVYPVALAHHLWGPPVDVQASAHMGRGGVDEQTAMSLRFAGGQLATLSCSLQASTRQEATLAGSEARVHIPSPWWRPDRLTLTPEDGEPAVHHRDFEANGYVHEVDEVHRCVRAGLSESPSLPLAQTVEIMETLDRIRALIGLRYPEDQADRR